MMHVKEKGCVKVKESARTRWRERERREKKSQDYHLVFNEPVVCDMRSNVRLRCSLSYCPLLQSSRNDAIINSNKIAFEKLRRCRPVPDTDRFRSENHDSRVFFCSWLY